MTLKIRENNQDGDASCSVVVAAAGASTRMDGQNKLFVEIGGMPILAHTLTALDTCREIREIIVVTRAEDIDVVASLCAEHMVSKISKVIVGGQTRLESVYYGVLQAAPDSKLIAVHDGARPFVTNGIVKSTIEAALKYSAAAPAVPVTSTVKQAKNGMVVHTLNRDELFEIQTPQIFVSELIKGALQNAVDKKLHITDDCMAVEAIGFPVRLTAGTRENIKLTTSVDIAFAEAIYKMRRGIK